MPSKLGPHNLRPTADAKVLVEAGCKLVKLVEDFGAAPEYLAINPNLIIIGRSKSHLDNREVTAENLRHIEPRAAAQRFVELQTKTYRDNPLIKIWEGLNEPAWEDEEKPVQAAIDNYAWYAAFEAHRVQLLANMGLRAVVGNFSVGTPHIADNDVSRWTAFLPALVAADRHHGFLGLHEYSLSGQLSAEFDGAEGWWCFRYRKVHRLVLAPNHIDLDIVLTEYGTDYKIRDIHYGHELAWADGELRKDAYLLGATIFTFGSDNSAWDNFNVEGSNVTQALNNHIRLLSNVADPAPTPTPPLTTTLKVGDRLSVTPGGILNVRDNPAGNDIGDLHPGDIVALTGGPVQAAFNGVQYLWWQHDRGGWSIEPHLQLVPPEPTPTPEPEPMPSEIVFATNWAQGQAAIPGHDNIRVPRSIDGNFEIEYLDNVTEPHLLGADPNTIYLAPESTMRSGDTVEYPFTERLPDSELDLYLAPDAPIVYHVFKHFGKQWWTLSKRLTLPAGEYKFAVEVYPDIYSGNHVWAPDPLSGEYRLIYGEPFLGDEVGLPFIKGNFGQWIELQRTITHAGGEFRHGVMFRARYGVETVGLFIRRWKVTRIGEVVPPIDPPPPSATGPSQETLARWAKTAEELASEISQWVE